MNVPSSISKVADKQASKKIGERKDVLVRSTWRWSWKKRMGVSDNGDNASTQRGRNLTEEEGKLADFAEDAVHKQGLCVEILAGGFVQSYVDFFC